MSQTDISNETAFSDGGQPRVSDLLRKFEKISRTDVPKSKSLNRLVVSSASDSENHQEEENTKRSIHHSNEAKVTESKQDAFSTYFSEKPRVPPKKLNLRPVPPLRRSKTMRNPRVSEKEKIVEEGQNDVLSLLPPKLYGESTVLLQNSENTQMPVPRARIKIEKPTNRNIFLNICGDENNIVEKMPEATNVPALQPRKFIDITTESSNDQRARNDFVVVSNGIPYTPQLRLATTYSNEISLKGRGNYNNSEEMLEESDIPSLPPKRFIVRKSPENQFVLRNRVSDVPSTGLNSAHLPKENNKGVIKRTHTMHTTHRTKPTHNDFYTTETNYSREIKSKRLPDDSMKSKPNVHRYENYPIDLQAPPLPPKSSTVRRTASTSKPSLSPSSSSSRTILEKNSSFLDAVQKLNDLKLVFGSASTSKPDKYNKSILVLIEIMIDAIQENFLEQEKTEDDDGCNAWYSNIRDFVHHETEDYLKENLFEDNNRDIPYDKLLYKMVPKFIGNYVNTQSELSHSDEEERYERYEPESDNPKLDQEDATENMMEKMLMEVIRTESNYLSSLESYVDEHNQQKSFGDLVSAIDNLCKMQHGFKNTLQENSDYIVGILKTFLEFENLFKLYVVVEIHCSKLKIIDDEDASEDFESTVDLETLLLNRLNNYRSVIENIVEQMNDAEEWIYARELAEEVMEMLNLAIDRYNDSMPSVLFASNQSKEEEHEDGKEMEKVEQVKEGEEGTFYDDSQDITDTDKVLANLVPPSHHRTEYGTLLLRDFFKIDNHRKYFHVFLFEKVVVVTKEISKDTFSYKYGLKLDQLVLLPQEKNKKVLKLKDYFKTKSSNTEVIIKMVAKTEEIQQKWRTKINNCLWNQLTQKREETKKPMKLIPL